MHRKNYSTNNNNDHDYNDDNYYDNYDHDNALLYCYIESKEVTPNAPTKDQVWS